MAEQASFLRVATNCICGSQDYLSAHDHHWMTRPPEDRGSDYTCRYPFCLCEAERVL